MSNFDETLNLIDATIDRKVNESKDVKVGVYLVQCMFGTPGFLTSFEISLQVMLDQVDKEIEIHSRRAPARPSRTLEDINNEIERLRHEQSVLTLPVKVERELVRQISVLNKEKLLLGPWGEYEVSLNVLRDKRRGIQDCLATINADLQKLRDGRRLVEATKKAQALNPGVEIQPSDILVEEVPVNDDALPRIIGRKHSSLREIEDACGVVIEVVEAKDRQGKKDSSSPVPYPFLRIRGLAPCIKAAKERVTNVSDQVEGTCTLSTAMLNYLISNEAAGVKSIEDNYAVRVHIVRGDDKKPVQVNLRGLIEDINAAKSAIAHAERAKKFVTVAKTDIARLIGNKGIHLKRLEEETNAGFHIDREGEGNEAKVWVAAFGADAANIVAKAVIALDNHVAENAEVEVPIVVAKDFCPWIVGKGGKRINQFQTDTGVFARIVRPGTASDVPNLPADAHAVVLKGTRAAIATAQVELNRLLGEFAAEHAQIPVTAQQARVLTGPGGTIINSLRSLIPKDAEDKPVASIDISEASGDKENEKKGGDKNKRINRADELGLPAGHGLITIRGDSATVASLVSYVKQLLPSIQNPKFSFPTPRCIVLSRRGEALRNLENEAQAFVEVEVNPDSDDSVISFLGLPAGVSALQNKLSEWTHIIVPLQSPLIARELTARVKDLAALQVDGAFVELTKEPARVIIAGPSDAVNKAHASVLDMLSSYHTVQIDPSLIPTLIGPKGATINSISEESKATIHVDDAGVVLVHGDNDAVAAAMNLINNHCRLDSPSITVPYNSESISRILGKGSANIKKIQTEYNVSIVARDSTTEFIVRGAAEDIEKAAVALRKLIREFNRVEQETTIPEKIVGTVIGSGGSRLKSLTESTNTQVDIDRSASKGDVAVKVRGTPLGNKKVLAFLEAMAAGKEVKYITRPSVLTSNLKNAMKLSAVTPFGATVRYFPADEPVEGEIVNPNDVQFMDFVLVTADDETVINQALYAVDSLLIGDSDITVQSVKLSSALVAAAAGPKKNVKKSYADALSPKKLNEKYGITASLDGSHITLWGPSTSVVNAVTQIEEARNQWDSTHAEIALPASLIPMFVGKDGSKLNQLKSQHKINIDIERSDVGSSASLVLEAEDAELLNKARTALEAQVNNLTQLRVRYSVPRAACVSIIGKGGATIRSLQTDCKCYLDVDVGTATISVIGEDVEGFDKVKKTIAEHAENAEGTATVITDAQAAQLSEKVDIAPLLRENVTVSAFIGKGGSNLDDLAYHLGREGAQFTFKEGVVTVSAPTPAALAQGVQTLKDAAHSFQEGDEEIAPTFTPAPLRASNLPVGLVAPKAAKAAVKQAKPVLPVQSRPVVEAASTAAPAASSWVTVGSIPKSDKTVEQEPTVTKSAPSKATATKAAVVQPVIQARPAPVVSASDSTTALLASIFGESETASMLGINVKKSTGVYVGSASTKTVSTGKSFASITATAAKPAPVVAPVVAAPAPVAAAPVSAPKQQAVVQPKAAKPAPAPLQSLQPLASTAPAPVLAPLAPLGAPAARPAPVALPSLGSVAPAAAPAPAPLAISKETLASLTPDIVALLQSQSSPVKPLAPVSQSHPTALPFPLPSLSQVAPPPGLPVLSPSLKPLAAPPGLGANTAPKPIPLAESNEKKFVPRPGPVWGKTSKA